MELVKIQMRFYNKDNDSIWRHFCYVPTELKESFDLHVNTHGLAGYVWIANWAFADFGILYIDTEKGFVALKEAVHRRYKELYPEIFIDSPTDKQGWLRVWYTQKMKEELTHIGK